MDGVYRFPQEPAGRPLNYDRTEGTIRITTCLPHGTLHEALVPALLLLHSPPGRMALSVAVCRPVLRGITPGRYPRGGSVVAAGPSASSTGCSGAAVGSGRTAGRSVSSTVVPGTSRS